MAINKPDLKTLSQTDVANLLDVSTETLRQWRDRYPEELGPLPGHTKVGPKNVYDWAPVLAWYVRYQALTRLRDIVVQAPDGQTIEEAKRQAAWANAELAKIELAQAQGKLIEYDEAKRFNRDLVLKIRAKLLSIPHRVASLVTDGQSVPEKVDIIDTEIRDILKELATDE